MIINKNFKPKSDSFIKNFLDFYNNNDEKFLKRVSFV